MKKPFRLEVILTAAYNKFLSQAFLGNELESFMKSLDELAEFLTEDQFFSYRSHEIIVSVLRKQCPRVFDYASIDLAYAALQKHLSEIELDNFELQKARLERLRLETDLIRHDIKSI